MQRKRVLAGIVLVIGMLLVIIITKLVSGDSEIPIPKDTSVKNKVSVADKQAYQSRQRKLQTAFKTYFDKAIRSGNIVGAGVSIVEGDSILVSTGFGKRSINTRTKVDGETIFRLGSLSKGFGGVLAASVEAEGTLNLNDKLTDYLPKFQLGDASNTAKIKIAHILSHSSGAPYHSFTNLVEADIRMAEIAERFHEVNVQSAPGQQYSYQNAMFALSQEVLQKATGKDVKTALKNKFFKPLGMTRTSMNHEVLMKAKNVALPHVRRKNGWKTLPLKDRYYNAVVAGGINASSSDMARWMRFLLGGNPEVVPLKKFAKAFEPFIEIDYNNKYYQRWPGHKQSHYGFGWRIHTYQEGEHTKEKTIWHHGGSVNNYRNEIALFPEDEIGICVLLNGNSRLAQTVIPDIYAMVKALD